MSKYPETKPRKFLTESEFQAGILGICPKCEDLCGRSPELQDGRDEYWRCRGCGVCWLITCRAAIGEFVDKIPGE